MAGRPGLAQLADDEGAALAQRLLPEAGVLVVEPKRPLRAEDFDALAMMVDPWIETHGELRGVVVHAREFPGWETLGAFFRHLPPSPREVSWPMWRSGWPSISSRRRSSTLTTMTSTVPSRGRVGGLTGEELG